MTVGGYVFCCKPRELVRILIPEGICHYCYFLNILVFDERNAGNPMMRRTSRLLQILAKFSKYWGKRKSENRDALKWDALAQWEESSGNWKVGPPVAAMSSTLLERTRASHEELERLNRTLVAELKEPPKSVCLSQHHCRNPVAHQ